MRTIRTIIVFLFLTGKVCGQTADSSLKISHLTGDFYVFTTYNLYNGSRIPANGMYLITDKGAVVFDTPWDTTQFQPLINSIQARHGKKVILCIATHFHDDRTGGLEYFRKYGSQTFTTRHTDELSKKNGMKRAEYLMDKDTVFKIGQYSFQTYFPGHGHAPDNIVIWFEKEKILYGACLIKSVQDNTLGNLSDASIPDYATTIKNVQSKCRNPKYIITGHNDWTNKNSLDHTLKMAQELNQKKSR
jgi:metallo-beta-lactamase class B